MRKGCLDWRTGSGIDSAVLLNDFIDIHHILSFTPVCKSSGLTLVNEIVLSIKLLYQQHQSKIQAKARLAFI